MHRSPVIRLLLSLVLLMSQQMALTHAMSHWTDLPEQSVQRQNDRAGKPLKAATHDQNCAQCFAYAQLASALGSRSHAFFGAELAFLHPALPAPSADCARTVCVFHSRAPPQA